MQNDVTKILYVEDEPDLLEIVLEEMNELKDENMEFHGVHIQTTADEQKVYDELQKGGYWLIIADQRMPVRGSDIIGRVHERFPDIGAIVLSAWAEFKDVDSAYRSGIFDYVRKQDIRREPERLIGRIRSALQKVRLSRENRAYQKALEQSVVELSDQAGAVSLGRGIAHHGKNALAKIKGAGQSIESGLEDIQDFLGKLKELVEAQSQEELDEILADMQAMTGDIEYLSTEQIPSSVQALVRDVNHLDTVIEHLKTFAQVDMTHVKPVRPDEGITLAAEFAAPALEPRGVKVHTQFAQDVPEFSCNVRYMNNVYLNIITNAAEFGASTITISTEFDAKERVVRLVFEDDGQGIEQAALSKVFYPFYTTKEVPTALPDAKGTGLGLFVAKIVVERMHGGRIYCQSEPGKFTRFVIELPA